MGAVRRSFQEFLRLPDLTTHQSEMAEIIERPGLSPAIQGCSAYYETLFDILASLAEIARKHGRKATAAQGSGNCGLVVQRCVDRQFALEHCQRMREIMMYNR